MRKKKVIKVAELFAGVGGFRLGLEGWNKCSASSGYKEKMKRNFEVVWSNQWEPSTLVQHASDIYKTRWGDKNHSNEDIEKVDIKKIPEFDLLVGGFPCQDYSVASLLKQSKGLAGKKGILFWSIHRILRDLKNRPKYFLLENVDRLLQSPKNNRGRDFAVMLESLGQLGYAVEWRIINAADYGMPQKRKRVFIFGYHSSTPIYKKLLKSESMDWILKDGIFADAFPVELDTRLFKPKTIEINLEKLEKFVGYNKELGFLNSGIFINNFAHLVRTKSSFKGKLKPIKSIIQKGAIPDEYYLNKEDMPRWIELKGSKSKQMNNNGYKYIWSEGPIQFPDCLNKPARTIITREGHTTPSRFSIVIDSKKGLRRLTPVEIERANMFPDNHTKYKDLSNGVRAMLMGNALVVGVVEKLGQTLIKYL